MCKHVVFNVNHLDVMDVREEYKASLLALDSVRYVLSNIKGGPEADAVTVLQDGKILMCMGYLSSLPGVAEVWLFPSIYVEKFPITFVREVSNYLNAIADTFGWHRIQTVTQDTPQHRKWMKVLGFVEEGIMKNYFQGKDFIMSARYFSKEGISK